MTLGKHVPVVVHLEDQIPSGRATEAWDQIAGATIPEDRGAFGAGLNGMQRHPDATERPNQG
jgi:hypothetical protein